MKKLIQTIFVLAVAGWLTHGLHAGKDNANVGFGELFYEDEVVRTVVPPATMPKEGTDPLYVVTNGVDDQLPIIGVAPGDKGYHGGKWAFHEVTWAEEATPVEITSEKQLLYLELDSQVTVKRIKEMDFKCPVQP